MSCNRPHDDPEWIADGGLPRFLCRVCNPVAEITPEERAAFEAKLRASQVRENEARRRADEIRKTRHRIGTMERSNNWGRLPLDPVSQKVYDGLKAKLVKLEAQNG